MPLETLTFWLLTFNPKHSQYLHKMPKKETKRCMKLVYCTPRLKRKKHWPEIYRASLLNKSLLSCWYRLVFDVRKPPKTLRRFSSRKQQQEKKLAADLTRDMEISTIHTYNSASLEQKPQYNDYSSSIFLPLLGSTNKKRRNICSVRASERCLKLIDYTGSPWLWVWFYATIY